MASEQREAAVRLSGRLGTRAGRHTYPLRRKMDADRGERGKSAVFQEGDFGPFSRASRGS